MKKRIGIIFGGRSDEREISVLSAASVLSAIDREKYEPVPILIGKSGDWLLCETDLGGLFELSDPRIRTLGSGATRVTLADFDEMTDFAFPLLHGPYGEDGRVQGVFEMLGKPYAGCGVAAAAVSMDKIFMKGVWDREGLPQSRYTYTTRRICGNAGTRGIAGEAARIEGGMAYPIFVKPANMGSSIGVSKVDNRAGLEAAIGTALQYDDRVIAEEAVCGREIEIGLLGNEAPEASAIGEILANAVYYDYDSKYRDSGTRLVIPADIPESGRGEIEALATKAYIALDGEGFARVDMFYDERAGKAYLNEMNSIPGFTRYSMFPLLWEAKGTGFTELIERIIDLGYERHYAADHRQPGARP